MFLAWVFFGFANQPLSAQETQPEINPLPESMHLLSAYTHLRNIRYQWNLTELILDQRLNEMAAQVMKSIEREGVDYAQKSLQGSIALKLAREVGYSAHRVQMIVISQNRTIESLVDKLQAENTIPVMQSRDWIHIGIAFRDFTGGNDQYSLGRTWVFVMAEPARPAFGNWIDSMLTHVNAFREEHELPPIQYNEALSRAAQLHVDDMALRDYFSHFSPEKWDVLTRATWAGYNSSKVLENLAAGQDSVKRVVETWKESTAGHREAMIDADVRDIGIGYRYLTYDPGEVNFNHYWAIVLGRAQSP
ncbi:MAG: CAP domain-containing protein [Pseudomonadota bacterium]